MTAATITDVMLPSFATILHELAFQIETVVFRICGTASGMGLHGSPTWTQEELESHSCDLALVNRGGCVALITALGEKGDLPHPIALDYAVAGTWLQGHQTRRLNSKSHNRLGRINTSGILLTQRISCFMSRPGS